MFIAFYLQINHDYLNTNLVCTAYLILGMQFIPKMGMLSVSREITPFWYEMHTFVLTVWLVLQVWCMHLTESH